MIFCHGGLSLSLSLSLSVCVGQAAVGEDGFDCLAQQLEVRAEYIACEHRPLARINFEVLKMGYSMLYDLISTGNFLWDCEIALGGVGVSAGELGVLCIAAQLPVRPVQASPLPAFHEQHPATIHTQHPSQYHLVVRRDPIHIPTPSFPLAFHEQHPATITHKQHSQYNRASRFTIILLCDAIRSRYCSAFPDTDGDFGAPPPEMHTTQHAATA